MSWLWPVLGFLLWLFLARLCARWTIELDYEGPRGSTLIFAALFFFWIGLPKMLPAYMKRRGIHYDARRLLGESGWHRRQRLRREHEERARDVGLAP